MTRKQGDVKEPERPEKAGGKARKLHIANDHAQEDRLPPEIIEDTFLRNSWRKCGKLSPHELAKLDVIDCHAKIMECKRTAAKFRQIASEPNCNETDAQAFRHEADILAVESFRLGLEQRQAFSDLIVATQVHAAELACKQTMEVPMAKRNKRNYTKWSKSVQKEVATLWNAHRENGGGTRTSDCFDCAKETNRLPKCITGLKDFRACLESARKQSLTHRVKRKRVKITGK